MFAFLSLYVALHCMCPNHLLDFISSLGRFESIFRHVRSVLQNEGECGENAILNAFSSLEKPFCHCFRYVDQYIFFAFGMSASGFSWGDRWLH